jgi:CDP-diacylglycerol---serine O-phosphatidyltransferase
MNTQPFRRMDDLRRSKRMRKGMFILPSLFTAGNIAAGYFAIAQCILGVGGEFYHFDWAARAIGFAVLFDGLDGRIARMTNTSSEFGKQLDSLADVITFGVAPGILAFMWGFRFVNAPFDNPDWRIKLIQLGGLVSFLFLMASASRLARFNIQHDPKPSNPGRPGKKYFVGMPTPAGAGVIAAVVHFSYGDPVRQWWIAATWAALIFAVGYLEVSTWRFPSFKDLDLRKQQSFRLIVLIGALIWGIVAFSGPVLFVVALAYMLSGVLFRLSYALRKSPSPVPATE